jgi:hypothetical protein
MYKYIPVIKRKRKRKRKRKKRKGKLRPYSPARIPKYA